MDDHHADDVHAVDVDADDGARAQAGLEPTAVIAVPIFRWKNTQIRNEAARNTSMALVGN